MEILHHLRPLRPVSKSLRATALTLATILLAGGCASAANNAQPLAPRVEGAQWPVKTREHVDLWLHGFAMIDNDTAKVPLYDRGYRDRLTVIKNSRNIYTDLDANRNQLASALATRPNLLAAQFLALYFGSWEELVRAFEFFRAAEGDPRKARNQEAQRVIAFLAQYFPNPEDRDFANRFVQSLISEQNSFHHEWWLAEQRARGAALAAADSLWQSRWRPAIQRYLNQTQQGSGDLIPSITLGGEGRALPLSGGSSQFAIAWPATPDSAEVLLFAFAHEAAGAIAGVAIADHLTPVQQREGWGDRYSSSGLVRGGALIVEHIDPALAERYARWYLSVSGAPAPSGNALTALAAAFPMPDEMIASMKRQLAISFGGI